MAERSYDIQQLVSASGVPRRTIYFYVQQGVLPPPEGAGLAAHYSEDHLTRLRLIPVLRQQGLRLDEIRSRFTQMDETEMQRMLNSRPQATAPMPPSPQHKRETSNSMLPDLPLGWGERGYTHYTLPAGISIVAPGDLSPMDRQRLNRLLQAAREIFTGNQFIYFDVGSTNNSTPSSEEE